MTPRFQELPDVPKYFAECCISLSKDLVETLCSHLPRANALVLSVGSGSGFLEYLLFDATGGELNILGVEVSSCVNVHLPEERVLRVHGSHDVHNEAVLASALMFVYPRQPSLVKRYLELASTSALETVIWLGPKCDWPDYESLLSSAFQRTQYCEVANMTESEMLIVATEPQ